MNKEDFIQWATKLQVNYQANEAVRAQLAGIDLVALVGPTGVGKTTIIEKLDLPFVASDVTRVPREGERNGHEYFFRDDYYNMLDEIKKGQYVQFLIARSGQFYGSRASSYPAIGTATMAVVASAIPLFRQLGFKSILPIYVLPPSYVEWMRRIGTGRALDLDARMNEARESLPMAMKDPAYHMVLNDDLDLAVSEVKALIAGQKLSQHRHELAHSSADLLFGRLGVNDDLLN